MEVSSFSRGLLDADFELGDLQGLSVYSSQSPSGNNDNDFY